MTLYANPDTLIRDIIAYLRVQPDADIAVDDDPQRQVFGFRLMPQNVHGASPLDPPDNAPRWEISSSRVSGGRSRYVTHLQTAAQRRGLIEVLRGQAMEGVLLHEEQTQGPPPRFTPEMGYYCDQHLWLRQAQQVLDTLTMLDQPTSTITLAWHLGCFEATARNTLQTLYEDGFIDRDKDQEDGKWFVV